MTRWIGSVNRDPAHLEERNNFQRRSIMQVPKIIEDSKVIQVSKAQCSWLWYQVLPDEVSLESNP
jgi:hypothetical protein